VGDRGAPGKAQVALFYDEQRGEKMKKQPQTLRSFGIKTVVSITQQSDSDITSQQGCLVQEQASS